MSNNHITSRIYPTLVEETFDFGCQKKFDISSTRDVRHIFNKMSVSAVSACCGAHVCATALCACVSGVFYIHACVFQCVICYLPCVCTHAADPACRVMITTNY